MFYILYDASYTVANLLFTMHVIEIPRLSQFLPPPYLTANGGFQVQFFFGAQLETYLKEVIGTEFLFNNF